MVLKTGATFILATASAAVLSGCNSTGGSVEDPAVFAAEAGTVEEALADGQTLTSVASGVNTSSTLNYADGSVTDIEDQEFSIAENDEGGYDVVIGDETTTFTGDDIYDSGRLLSISDGDEEVYVQLYWQSPHLLAGFYRHANDGDINFGYASVGTQTDPADMDGWAQASYDGFAAMTFQSDNVYWGFSGDLDLESDFSDGEISGLISNIVEATNNDAPVAGTITLEPGAIDGATFAGMLTADGSFSSHTELGEDAGYVGKFYGPDGEEVGGVLSGTTNHHQEGEMVMTGVYAGSQN